MEMEEIIKILIFIVVLTVIIGSIIFVFKGKGGGLIDVMRRSSRLG